MVGEYVNAHSDISIICPAGHATHTRWNDFRRGSRCRVCCGFCDDESRVKQILDSGWKVIEYTKWARDCGKIKFVIKRTISVCKEL